ncbi:hypothetical protein, partial [Paenibacillus xylanexedens]|uniref:hypothetical protein n=1 Tax=Paenibacillus xylanexedens TaxID=528191 RepID=UPI001C92FE56
KDEGEGMEMFEGWGVICGKVGKVRDDGGVKVTEDGEVVGDMGVRGVVEECGVYDKPCCVGG